MAVTKSDVKNFKMELIMQSGDHNVRMTAEQRAIFSLLSVPLAAQEICSKEQLEEILSAVTKAIKAHHMQEGE